MGISSFYGLQTSLRGLQAMQRSIDTTGHNISNASTVGYSRQEATLSASAALTIPAGATQNGAGSHIGSGVDVQSYRRVRDTFLDLQYRAQNTNLGGHAATTAALDRAELSLAEPSADGIASQISKFWDSWAAVNNNSNNQAARQALVSQGQKLGDAFKTVDAQLTLVASQAADEYASMTGPNGDVASIAKEIAGLNDTIAQFVTAGDSPNDLMDRRDVLLDKLSTFGQVSIANGSQAGSIVVKFGDAADALVTDKVVNWPQTLTEPGGKLGALLSVGGPTGQVAAYRASLDTVANQLATSVNDLHRQGAAGLDFFAPGATAGSLNVAVTAATVATSTTTNVGANDLALKIAGLRNGAADGAYQAFVARIGTDVAGSKRAESNAQTLVDAVDDRRSSVSGVALDEEMSNLIRFQRGYQASSRAMSTMDEMLDVLINRTGRVGL